MASRRLTHEREMDSGNWRGRVAEYRDGIAPLIQARKLKAILLQLPPNFDRRHANRLYLAHLLDELADLPVAVAFRHRSWATDRVFAELEKRKGSRKNKLRFSIKPKLRVKVCIISNREQ